jgi:hypothetical protein
VTFPEGVIICIISTDGIGPTRCPKTTRRAWAPPKRGAACGLTSLKGRAIGARSDNRAKRWLVVPVLNTTLCGAVKET